MERRLKKSLNGNVVAGDVYGIQFLSSGNEISADKDYSRSVHRIWINFVPPSRSSTAGHCEICCYPRISGEEFTRVAETRTRFNVVFPEGFRLF